MEKQAFLIKVLSPTLDECPLFLWLPIPVLNPDPSVYLTGWVTRQGQQVGISCKTHITKKGFVLPSTEASPVPPGGSHMA